PADEPSYRAQFILNVDSLTGVNSVQGVKVFGATTDAPANSISDLVRLTATGNLAGTQKILGVFTACAVNPGNLCSASLNLAAAESRVDIHYESGVGLKVWLNNTAPNTASLTLAGDNAAWGGVDFAGLGLSAPSPGYRTNQL